MRKVIHHLCFANFFVAVTLVCFDCLANTTNMQQQFVLKKFPSKSSHDSATNLHTLPSHCAFKKSAAKSRMMNESVKGANHS